MVDFVDDVDFLRLLPNFLVFVVVVLVDLKEVLWTNDKGDEGLVGVLDEVVVVVVNFFMFLVAKFLVFFEEVFGVHGGGGGVTESLDLGEGVGEGAFGLDVLELGESVSETSPDFKAFLNLCLGV